MTHSTESHPREPFASGFGIILGVVILWVATMVIVVGVRVSYSYFKSSDAEPSEEPEGVYLERGDSTGDGPAFARLPGSGTRLAAS